MADRRLSDLAPRLSRTCNLCKERKVRCIVVPGASSCASCIKRKVECHFAKTRRAVRQPQQLTPTSGASVSPGLVAGQPTPTTAEHVKSDPSSGLLIDQILQDPSLAGVHPVSDAQSIFKVHSHRLTSSNLAYFSEGHIRLICQRLGHNKLLDLVRSISNVVNEKFAEPSEDRTSTAQDEGPPAPDSGVSEATLRSYVESYFEHVHPLYPFLDKATFEASFFNVETRDTKPPFRALYHCVLALGCQYAAGDSSFSLGKGEAWGYFKIALSLIQDVFFPPGDLVNLQAITAMAIFGSNTAGLGIAEFLTMEAARMAQSLGYHRPMINHKDDEATCYRTFWVIYYLEKGTTFLHGRSSASQPPLFIRLNSISDHDVSCPIIPVPEERFKADFDMFVCCLRLGRLWSKAYERLFSVTANLKSIDQHEMDIDTMKSELEAWRRSTPEEVRPGSPISGTRIAESCLRLHCAYYDISIALGRLALYLGRKCPKREAHKARMEAAEHDLLESARAVARLTICIDIRPYTPLWILASLPLSAMFVLFDMTIQNPTHPETESDLALLDILGGYFSRYDYATGGSIPCRLFSGFAHIANQFVRDQGTRPSPPPAEESEIQDTTQGSHGVDFASRHNTTYDSNLFSQEFPSGSDSSSYPVLDEASAVDAQIFAGFDFSSLFDVNAQGFGVPGFGRPWG